MTTNVFDLKIYVCKKKSYLLYLNHLSSLELLDVAELAGFADQFATLQIDNALGVREGDDIHQKYSQTGMGPRETQQNTDMRIIIITGT